jgi:hypothetical protein
MRDERCGKNARASLESGIWTAGFCAGSEFSRFIVEGILPYGSRACRAKQTAVLGHGDAYCTRPESPLSSVPRKRRGRRLFTRPQGSAGTPKRAGSNVMHAARAGCVQHPRHEQSTLQHHWQSEKPRLQQMEHVLPHSPAFTSTQWPPHVPQQDGPREA